MTKYIVDIDCIYREQLYIEANSQEEAARKALAHDGIRMGLNHHFDKVTQITNLRETDLEID